MPSAGRHASPADPWSADAPTVGFARLGDTRTLAYPELGVPRRPRTPLFLGIGLVVALLAGIGAYVSASLWYGWNITEPEEVMPSDTALFARLDLSPGLGQRLALSRVARKFPHDGDGRDIAEQMKREFLGVDDETYQRDFRPWLGERLAAAAWSRDNTSTSACTLAALAAADESDARRSLSQVQQRHSAAEFGYVIHNGYALVARCDGRIASQAAADIAADRARSQSLAQLPPFTQALRELPGHPAAIAWADVAALRAIQEASGFTIAGLTLGDAVQTGQLVAGLEATDDGIDVNFRLSGAGAPHATVDVLSRLGAQPDNTAIGVCTDLKSSPVVSQLGQSLASALASGPFASLGTGLAQALGSVLTVAVTPLPSAGAAPAWQLSVETASRDRALALAVAFGLPGLVTGVSVKTDGNTMTATSRGYQPSTGNLADSPTFARAMDSPISRPAVAAYLDVASFMPTMRLTAQEAASLKPIQAAGMVIGDDGGTVAGLIRLLIP